MVEKALLLQMSKREPPSGIQRGLAEEAGSSIPTVAREATSCPISHPVNVTKKGSQLLNYSLPDLVPLALTCRCNTRHIVGQLVFANAGHSAIEEPSPGTTGPPMAACNFPGQGCIK